MESNSLFALADVLYTAECNNILYIVGGKFCQWLKHSSSNRNSVEKWMLVNISQHVLNYVIYIPLGSGIVWWFREQVVVPRMVSVVPKWCRNIYNNLFPKSPNNAWTQWNVNVLEHDKCITIIVNVLGHDKCITIIVNVLEHDECITIIVNVLKHLQ